MSAGNDPAAWQNFYIMIGTANAAITGLLFVALSLHLKQILAHAVYKPRAIVVLVILTTQIVISAIVLAPQPRALMGWEILILNVFFLALNVRNRAPARNHGRLGAHRCDQGDLPGGCGQPHHGSGGRLLHPRRDLDTDGGPLDLQLLDAAHGLGERQRSLTYVSWDRASCGVLNRWMRRRHDLQ